MTTSLRPMTTGEVLDRAFHLYRNNFLLFTGIGIGYSMFVLIGVLALAWAGLLARTPNYNNLLAIATSELVLLLCSLIGYALASGATISAASRIHLGHSAGVLDSYKTIGRFIWRFIRIVLSVFLRVMGALLLTEFLLGTVIGVLTSVINISGPSRVAGWTTLIITLAVLAGGLTWAARILCRNSLAVAACFVEKLPARQALMRSQWLTTRALGRMFIVLLLTGILSFVLAYALLLPGAFLADVVPNVAVVPIEMLGVFIGLTLAFPIGAIAAALLYYDLRVRKEAFDLQLMIETVGKVQQEAAVAADF